MGGCVVCLDVVETQGMIVPRRAPLHGVRQYVTATSSIATLRATQYGRTAAYRRLTASDASSAPLAPPSSLTPFSPRLTLSSRPLLRSLHTSRAQYQQTQPKEESKQEVRDPPRDEKPTEEASGEQKKQGEMKSLHHHRLMETKHHGKSLLKPSEPSSKPQKNGMNLPSNYLGRSSSLPNQKP